MIDSSQIKPKSARELPCTALLAPSAGRGAASLALMITSLSALDGCQAIKGIFEVGFGMGILLVVALVAIVGGVIAVATRK